MSNWENFRKCGTCGKSYNAKEYGNYFYCSWSCSSARLNQVNPMVHAYDDDGYYLGMYRKNDPYLNGLRIEEDE